MLSGRVHLVCSFCPFSLVRSLRLVFDRTVQGFQLYVHSFPAKGPLTRVYRFISIRVIYTYLILNYAQPEKLAVAIWRVLLIRTKIERRDLQIQLREYDIWILTSSISAFIAQAFFARRVFLRTPFIPPNGNLRADTSDRPLRSFALLSSACDATNHYLRISLKDNDAQELC